jgi:hypothetical protein
MDDNGDLADFQRIPFIPNVIGRQACRFICKIGLRRAASGAPAAVDSVHTLKNLPLFELWKY